MSLNNPFFIGKLSEGNLLIPGVPFNSVTGLLKKFFSGWLLTLCQNGHYFSGLLFAFKLALVASFLNSKYKRIFSLERGNKG